MPAKKTNLLDIYERLLVRYGRQHWWPGDTRFEIMIGAVLTQNTSWSNVEKAINKLRNANAIHPQIIRNIDHEDLAKLIHSSGYYNSKAQKLKALAGYIGDRFNDNLDAMELEECTSLRDELLNIYGIGEETADDILLYAFGKTTFVIDNYTKRVFSRIGLTHKKTRYSIYRNLFINGLPTNPDLFKEYHALIVRHAKEVCNKNPICKKCCLIDICITGYRSVTINHQITT